MMFMMTCLWIFIIVERVASTVSVIRMEVKGRWGFVESCRDNMC